MLRRIKARIKAEFKRDPKFACFIVLIIIIALFFKTYNYINRIELQSDNARDVQVAKYAADKFLIPQIGQFSSAGPFFYGPWYTWYLQIVNFLPLGFLGSWYATTLLYLAATGMIFWLGLKIGGEWVGALAALYISVSPENILSSFSVWSPTIVPILVSLSLVFLLRFFENRRLIDIAILGFILALSFSIHFQSILLFPTLAIAIAAVYLNEKSFQKILIYSLFAIVGFLIALAPLIYFDSLHQWHNFTSIFIFLAFDQFSVWIPNRWLTYAFIYWPQAWGNIIGGTSQIGAVCMGLISIAILLKLRVFKKKKGLASYDKLFFLVAVTFLVEFILYRYYRGQRFTYYSLFAHPMVVILTAWVSLELFKFKKFLGLLLIAIILAGTFKPAMETLRERTVSYKKLQALKLEVYTQLPIESYDIYGCEKNPNSLSHPLALMMYFDGRNSVDGVKVAVCENFDSFNWMQLPKGEVFKGNLHWYNRTTSVVYYDTQEWWKYEPVKESNFWEFLRNKFSSK